MHHLAWVYADHCKSTYLELQRKKVYRYVIFKIDEKKNEVVFEKTGGPAESYEDFTASLPENDCQYAVFFYVSDSCQDALRNVLANVQEGAGRESTKLLTSSLISELTELPFFTLLIRRAA
ncbi:Actin depolymerizing factor 6 [Forsythia ovata]|uniref:Actin depolymerizing factor 6 n=1 Tax=Forsythia ovata TaxID=205694 RepID=A0ABD1PI51_9LAMI